MGEGDLSRGKKPVNLGAFFVQKANYTDGQFISLNSYLSGRVKIINKITGTDEDTE